MTPPGSARTAALSIVVVAYILSFFHRFAPATIAADLATAFHTSAASLGVLAATYFYIYTIMQVPTGILVDTVGPRRILVTGSLMAAAGSALFALAPDLDVAILGRTLVGLGVSVVFIAMLKLIALWFDERRFATMVGVVMLLGNAGSILAGTPLAAVLGYTSWRAVFMGAACVSLLIAIASWFLIRDNAPARPATPRFDRTVVLGGLLGVLRNRDTWPVVVVNFGWAGSFFAFGGLWATPYLMQVHALDRVTAANHLSLFFAGFALGCLAIGTLSDRLGRRKPVLIGAGLIYCALWLVWMSALRMPLAVSYSLFAIMGVATASFSLTWACAKEVNPPHLSGMSTSVTNMGGFLAGALLQPAVGLVMDLSWDGTMVDGARHFTPASLLLGLSLVAGVSFMGLVASFFIRETGCRNVWQAPASVESVSRA